MAPDERRAVVQLVRDVEADDDRGGEVPVTWMSANDR